jgi:methionine sulfoxide reductase heme-binding subunit
MTSSAPAAVSGAPRARPYAWLQPGVLAGALVPAALLIYDAVRGTLGADPVAIALNRLGLSALICLLACLSATPLRLLFGLSWPLRVRKLLGLLAFFYASAHALLYALIDQGLDWTAMLHDVTQRKFITVGFVTWLLLIPLAVTSRNTVRKRLGPLRWQRLHRLVYLIAILAVLHFVWRVKRDLSQPLEYAALLAVLLAVRLFALRAGANRARAAVGR